MWQPLGNLITIRPDAAKELVSEGGVIIRPEGQKKPVTAVILAIGQGLRNEDGSLTPIAEQLGCELKAGDRIIYHKHASIKFDDEDGQESLFIDLHDVLGILDDTQTDVIQLSEGLQ